MRRTIHRGFTLIELLVVIGIIVILIGLVMGALGHAKRKAYETATRALMSNLSSDIEAYQQEFHAYPGPMNSFVTTNSTPSSKISGTQNLMLALTYGMQTTNTGNGVSIPGANNIQTTTGNFPALVDPTRVPGPTDYGSFGPDGNPTTHTAYFNPTAKQITTVPQLTAMTSAASTFYTLPVVIDAYPDGLPILYYRRSPGVEQSSLNNGKVVETDSTTATAPYYLNENVEYTSGTITATSGSAFPQTMTPLDLQTQVIQGSTTAVSARGGFVLLDAGNDRTFGSGGKNDDIVMIGGN